jgi:hypothetical protein
VEPYQGFASGLAPRRAGTRSTSFPSNFTRCVTASCLLQLGGPVDLLDPRVELTGTTSDVRGLLTQVLDVEVAHELELGPGGPDEPAALLGTRCGVGRRVLTLLVTGARLDSLLQLLQGPVASARRSSASASFILVPPTSESSLWVMSGVLGALEVHHLVQLVDNLDQVGLVGHDLGDRLVSIRVLVDQLVGHRVVPCPPRHGGSE